MFPRGITWKRKSSHPSLFVLINKNIPLFHAIKMHPTNWNSFKLPTFLITLSSPVFDITVSNSSFCSSMLLSTQYYLMQIISPLSLCQTMFYKILLQRRPDCWFIHVKLKTMEKRIFISNAIIYRQYVT